MQEPLRCTGVPQRDQHHSSIHCSTFRPGLHPRALIPNSQPHLLDGVVVEAVLDAHDIELLLQEAHKDGHRVPTSVTSSREIVEKCNDVCALEAIFNMSSARWSSLPQPPLLCALVPLAFISTIHSGVHEKVRSYGSSITTVQRTRSRRDAAGGQGSTPS